MSLRILEGKTILIVDDDLLISKLLTTQLTNAGANIMTAYNGKKAIEKLTLEKADLILMDLNMPVMDGFTAIEELKKRNDLKDIPVIVLTNMENPNDVQKVLEHGITEYLLKTEVGQKKLLEQIAIKLGIGE